MDDTWWIPLVAALVGALFVVVNTSVERLTARNTATLAAQQKRRDHELATLDAYREALFEAATSVQRYAFLTTKTDRLHLPLNEDETRRHVAEVEPAVRAIQAAKNRVGLLLVDDQKLNAAAERVHILLNAVTTSSGATAANPNRDAKLDPWDLAMDEVPDPITVALNAIADCQRELFATYPRELPSLRVTAWNVLLRRL